MVLGDGGLSLTAEIFYNTWSKEYYIIATASSIYAGAIGEKSTEPSEPTEPTTPEETSKSAEPADPESPKTGDAANLNAWYCMMVMSLLALTVLLVTCKKRFSMT